MQRISQIIVALLQFTIWYTLKWNRFRYEATKRLKLSTHFFCRMTKNYYLDLFFHFSYSFWGFEKYLCHYSLYSYCSTNWQIKFKKAQLLSHALDFMVWHVSLWALSCLSWVFYWVFGYIVESEVEKLHLESVKKLPFILDGDLTLIK